MSHAGLEAISELWERLDVALFGIGGPSWTAARVGDEIEGQLLAAEAVGEVLVAPFDIDGRFVCDALRERVIAVDARRLGTDPGRDRGRVGREQGPADPRRASRGRRPDPRHRRRDGRGSRGTR